MLVLNNIISIPISEHREGSDRRDDTVGPYSQRKLCENPNHKIFVVIFKITYVI